MIMFWATLLAVRRHDALPFPMVAVIFVAAFCTLAISFWPYMIPFSITVEQAAAPYSSLAFMFWGAGLFVFPLMLLYTAISLTVFRGKVVRPAGLSRSVWKAVKRERHHERYTI
jgi:cytochrome bd ubiquinol oxidase subunit II